MVENLTLVRTTDLTDQEIKDNQNERDIENLKYIEKKRQEGVIDSDAAKHLSAQYFGTMKKYEKFVLRMINSIGDKKIKSINPYNLKTRKPVESESVYGLKDITPNNPMMIVFIDERGNDINLYLPGMKSIVRALEKVKIDGKYDQQYKADLASGKPNPKKPHERLSDINRCLITAEFKGQLFELSDQLMENTTDLVDCEIENRFSNNLSDKKHRENLIKDPKNRRELKYRFKTKSDGFEVQYNYNGNNDIRTHGKYECMRQIKEKDPKLSIPVNRVRYRILAGSIVRDNSSSLEEYNKKTIREAISMKSEFEVNSMLKGRDKKLSKEEEKEIHDFINYNMEARRSNVFNPNKHLPKEFEEYKLLSDAVKSMYLFNNSEAVYGRENKPVKKASKKELPESESISKEVMQNHLEVRKRKERSA